MQGDQSTDTLPILDNNKTHPPLSLKMKSLKFGTANNFNFLALVSERKAHETAEALSAIAYRYRNAASHNEILTALTNTLTNTKSINQEPSTAPETKTESAAMKALVVNEITRVISTSLTAGSVKADASGAERLVRWRGLGLNIDGLDPTTPLEKKAEPMVGADADGGRTQASGTGDKLSRKGYAEIEAKLTIPFENAGVSSFCPLRPGHWLLIVFRDAVWLSQGMNRHDYK